MEAWSLDSLLPTPLVDESADVRRRARLVIYALGIAILVDVLTALAMPVVDWMANRVLWAAAHIALHLPTLLVLRTTRSVAKAGNYFVAVVFLQSTLQLETSNGFSAFGLIATPVAAAFLVGLRSASFWTVASVGAAFLLPTAIGASAQEIGLGVAVGTVTLAIGAASAIVEASRARTTRELDAAEAGVRLHRDRLRAFVEQTFPWTAEVEDGKLGFVSERAAELLGYTPAEIRAQGVALLRPEDVANLVKRVAARPPARSREEIRVRHRDGRWLWLEVFAIPVGASPADTSWLFAARGIDDEVRHRERLEQAQRLDGIGTLAAGVAHDFNNLLTVISGFGSQLPPCEAREQVLRAAGAAGELTSQLLAFGRSGPSFDELIDPQHELLELEPMIRSILGEEVGLELRGSANGATMRIAPGRFKQVLLNLVTNAKEAIAREGRVVVELQRLAIDAERAAELGLSAGPHVEIAVRDTGKGMSEEVRRRAFDPFYSTKGADRGSGLGLASAYGIARRCRGTITLESVVGRGTVARILLPDALEPLTPALASDARGALSATKARVWIVEDDARIRMLLESALAGAGHRVQGVPSGVEALALLEREVPPDLLVTDIVMPGMRGTELASRMREAAPQLRVLYVSGYSEVEVGDWRSGEVGVHFLAKPFRPSELLNAVSALTAE